jgi:flagellar hook-basal body complex protein FliE
VQTIKNSNFYWEVKMNIYKPSLVSGDNIPMTITHPRHMVPKNGGFTVGGSIPGGQGTIMSELGGMIGSDAVTRTGSFEDTMLRALDKVNASQQFSNNLAQQAIIDPESVDIHDITIAQSKARMSLDITRTILNRIVQGWKDLINTR